MTLLEQFLSEDATPLVRQLLLDSIATLDRSQGRGVREFTFNRFNVRIDWGKRVVSLEDELDTSEPGATEIALSDFAAALGKTA
jgi:hypothetical protein